MKLRELKYNVFFEYIKDIRRYNYDIEIFLKSENLCDIVNPTIPLPDEVEPLADRLNIVKDFENTTCIFAVSQMSLTTIIQYKNDIFEENKTKIELEQLKKYTDKLVDFLNSKISNFKIIFEGISVASSMMTKPDNIENFRKALDENLQSVNSDYEAKRYNNMTLNPLVLNVARENLFYDWLKQQDKLGGQHKVPRLSNERNYLESLLTLQ